MTRLKKILIGVGASIAGIASLVFALMFNKSDASEEKTIKKVIDNNEKTIKTNRDWLDNSKPLDRM